MATDAPAALTALLLAQHGTAPDGALAVGGLSAAELAARFGTPLYVYDAGVLRNQLTSLRAHLPARVEVYYSVKANPNPDVVRSLVEQGTGCEVASAREFLLARAAGCASDRIVFAGPGKGAADLELVVNEGIGEVHVESLEEIERLDALGRARGAPVPIAVRVNPSAAVGGGAMRMGGEPSPFGFDEELLPDVVAAIRPRTGVRLAGLHMFAGTQILDAEVLAQQWRRALDLAVQLGERAGVPLDTVDLGGGLGVPYFPHEKPLDLASVRTHAAAVFERMERDPALARTRFILEPGRFLAGPSGVYLTRVLTVKASRGQTFVVLDGGMNHHLAASGNLGQVIRRNYPVVNATRASAPATLEATVVGPLCTPLDTLARGVRLAPLAVGDVVAVLQSGAYGLSASPLEFLGHPAPAEVLVDQGQARLVRARGSFARPVASPEVPSRRGD